MDSILSTVYPNFRDLGNQITEDGSLICSGKLFRSPDLEGKSPEATAALQALQLDYIVDLRCPVEVMERKDVSLEGTAYQNTPVLPAKPYLSIIVCKAGRMLCLWWLLLHKGQRIKDQKIASYKAIPFSKAYQFAFQLMDRGCSFVFHCTEGKDRTGWLAAVIQYCLGMSKDAVRKEYLKSNECRPGKDRSGLQKYGIPMEQIARGSYCEFVHEELFDLAWNTAVEKYGSFDNYLLQVFQITPERIALWKTHYLQEKKGTSES